jgi:catechol 2,3-dioxygenase-like lactoylglutathione lyase family enzyme
VTATTLHHVGIVVGDLEGSMRDFSALLGLHFSDPVVYPFDLAGRHGSTEKCELRVSLWQEGPPFMELIEAHEEGLWALTRGHGLHHVGAMQENLRERAEELRGLGHAADAVIHFPGVGLKAVYLGTDHPHVHNVRFELIQPA